MSRLKSHCSRLLVCLLCIATADGLRAADNELTEAERRGGWQLLFDGKTSRGWRNYRGKKISDGWVVKDGALSRVARQAGDIVTLDKYKYFELSIEYKISKGGNSGIMFHVTEDGAAPWHSGPEVQLQDNVDGHDPQKAGWLYQLYKPVKPAWAQRVEEAAGRSFPAIDDATRPAGSWNHVYLRVAPKQSEVAVNGISYYYFVKGDAEWNKRVAASKFARYANFGKPTEGHVCLQDHGNPVSFRNVKIRRLAADGSVPDPIDGQLPLRRTLAFPKLKWEGWQGTDEKGRVRALRPMIMTHAADGSNRVFVGTQRGVIHVFDKKTALRTRVFLDISDRVFDWARNNEEGLLGLAFHPDFKANGELFVCYSSQAKPRTSIVSRFRVKAKGSGKADATGEEILMEIDQPFANHNGGAIAFGKDGYLYIALGDGGHRNDPLNNAQNLKNWMGSILRIDVNRKSAGRAYGIPADNPFLKVAGAKPEIYAYGFRNIWRMSFDRLTGKLWVGDVGQDLWEEVNIVQRGGNYGWSIREGSYAFGSRQDARAKPIDPIWEYDHQVGKSITGGIVYRGKRLPSLYGWYLYADYVSGKIWALKYDEATGKVTKNMRIVKGGIPVLAFGEDEDGEVYYLVGSVKGEGIYRFDASGAK